MKTSRSKFSKLLLGLGVASSILPAIGINTSAMEQRLGDATTVERKLQFEILKDIAVNYKYNLMEKIIIESKGYPDRNIYKVWEKLTLGFPSSLEAKLKDSSSCYENLLRGPVSGRWLSKYTASSLYNLVCSNKEFILKYLRDNSNGVV